MREDNLKYGGTKVVEPMTTFGTGATRSDDTEKLDYEGFLSPEALRLFASYMHEHRRQADGQMRASDNWQKGMPISRYRKSLLRHYVEDLWPTRNSGITTTFQRRRYIDALCAIVFNAMGLLHEAAKGNFTDADQQPTKDPDPILSAAIEQKRTLAGEQKVVDLFQRAEERAAAEADALRAQAAEYAGAADVAAQEPNLRAAYATPRWRRMR